MKGVPNESVISGEISMIFHDLENWKDRVELVSSLLLLPDHDHARKLVKSGFKDLVYQLDHLLISQYVDIMTRTNLYYQDLMDSISDELSCEEVVPKV